MTSEGGTSSFSMEIFISHYLAFALTDFVIRWCYRGKGGRELVNGDKEMSSQRLLKSHRCQWF